MSSAKNAESKASRLGVLFYSESCNQSINVIHMINSAGLDSEILLQCVDGPKNADMRARMNNVVPSLFIRASRAMIQGNTKIMQEIRELMKYQQEQSMMSKLIASQGHGTAPPATMGEDSRSPQPARIGGGSGSGKPSSPSGPSGPMSDSFDPVPINMAPSMLTNLSGVSDNNTIASGSLTFMDWNTFNTDGGGNNTAGGGGGQDTVAIKRDKVQQQAPTVMTRMMETGQQQQQQQGGGMGLQPQQQTLQPPPPTSTSKSAGASSGSPESQYERLLEARKADEGSWS